MRGIYVLLIELDGQKVILAGKKRHFDLPEGFYGYVGSALSGLETRVARHLRSTKKLRWHIDYLLTAAKIRKIICAETSERMECTLAQMLSNRLPWIASFGCSDCKCQSHLFYCDNLSTLEIAVFDVIKSLELEPFVSA